VKRISSPVVTDDNDTPAKKKQKKIEPFVEVRFDIDPNESYYLPDRYYSGPLLGKPWMDLLGESNCNKIYL
jgi:hypothetical protein